MILFLRCLVVAIALGVAGAQVFTPEDADAIRALLDKTDASTSVQEAYYVAATQQLLSGGASSADALIAVAEQRLKSPGVTLEESYFAAKLLLLSKSPDQAAAKKAADMAIASLETFKSADTAYFATGILDALKNANLPHGDVSSSKLDALVADLSKLKVSTSNNRFRSSSGGRVSVRSTGRVYSALAAATSLASLSSASMSAIEAVKASVDEAVTGASDYGLSTAADIDVLEATKTFLLGAQALKAHADPFKVSKLAAFLVASKKATSAADAFNVVAGLSTLPAFGPVAISLVTPSLSISGKGQLKVRVTDFNGQPLAVEDVALTAGRGKDAIYTDKSFKPADKTGDYVADFFTTPLKFGIYNVAVTVGQIGGSLGGAAEFRVVVSDKIQVPEAEIALEEDGKVVGTITLSAGETLPPNIKSLSAKGSLKVAARVLTSSGILVPQQLAIAAKSKASGAVAYIPGKAVKDSPGDFVIDVSAASIARQIGPQGGEFSLRLLAGDEAAAAPIDWELGTLAITQPTGGEVAPRGAAAAALPKPEIRHVMRTPAKMPPAFVSYAFAVLAVLPLPLALFAVHAIGGNFKEFPTAPSVAIPALAFHSGIAAILMLAALFWLRLNLLDTLPLLGFLGLFTVIIGHRALSGLSRERLEREAAKNK